MQVKNLLHTKGKGARKQDQKNTRQCRSFTLCKHGRESTEGMTEMVD